MRLLLLILGLVTGFGLLSARTSEVLKVKLPHGGVLVGRYLNSISGKGIRAFMGVPYAEAPVGDLRFRVSMRRIRFCVSLCHFPVVVTLNVYRCYKLFVVVMNYFCLHTVIAPRYQTKLLIEFD